MNGLGSEAIMRLLAQQVPAMARRAVPVPATRLASVAQTTDPTVTYVEVTVDGDADPISVLNGTGQTLASGQRVIVLFYPPHGAIVVGLLLPVHPLEQHWRCDFDVASHDTSSTVGTGGWTLLTEAGVGWHDVNDDLVCDVPGQWALDLYSQWESHGAGDHRAAALVDAAVVHQVGVSQQFNAPGGTPTTGYGLAVSGQNVQDFVAEDTLSALARQNSGFTLAVTLTARLRLLGPSA